MRKVLVSLLAVFALAASAWSADATGKWTGTFVPEGGEGHPAILMLKQAGTAISGTAGPSPEQQWAIQAGKIETNTNKVSVQVQDPDNGRVYKLELVLDGDHMKGDITASDGADTMRGKVELDRQK